MPSSYSQGGQFPDRTDGHEYGQVVDRVPDLADAATLTPADSKASHSHHGGMPFQDPFTYYKAFFSTESSSPGRPGVMTPHNDGNTRCEFRAELLQGVGDQQQSRPPAVPYNLAVRLANRSDGAPLATIIEQGSVSTLNSHGSLLSVGRFSSIRAVENLSPVCSSHRASRSLDDKALKNMQEQGRNDYLYPPRDTSFDAQAKPVRGGKSDPQHNLVVSPGLASREQSNFDMSRLPDSDLGLENKGLRGLLRGVLTNVRSSTRSRSGSSSMTDPSKLRVDEEQLGAGDSNSPSSTSVGEEDQKNDPPTHSVSATARFLHSSSSLPHHASEPQSRDRSSPSDRTEPTAGGYTCTSHLPPPSLESRSEPRSVPQLLPLPDLSRPRNDKELLASVRPVAAEAREAASDHVHHTATTFLSKSRDELSARYTPDGALLHRNDDQTLLDYARDPSRNASFCSTMSTSYSGTVLGIDLDLQHEFPHATRRSVTPVWFSPIENVVTPQEQPKGEPPIEGDKSLCPRSITSSALTSLLPIAAAEGIVRQNVTLPQLSFHSPSGNLIQAQDTSTSTPATSSRSRSNSYFSETPVTSSSYYSSTNLPSAQAALSTAGNLPPARPAPVPLTTPPQSTSPLPEHLRHHHNYRHAEKSQIGSTSDSDTVLPSRLIISSSSKVKGCGGVVQPTSSNPHSGVPPCPPKHTKNAHSLSCLPVNEADKSSLGFLLSRPAPKKGRTLKKRPPQTDKRLEHGSVGPMAGHALRVCFCQPYDGAGKQTSEGCGGTGLQGRAKACVRRGADEWQTPNTRVVSRDGNAEHGRRSSKGKSRARSESAVSVGGKAGMVVR